LQLNYITDLGVRFSREPKVFLEASLKTLGLWGQGWQSWERRVTSRFGELDSSYLVGLLDASVNFAGDWSSAASLAALSIKYPHNDYWLYLYSAVVQAAMDDGIKIDGCQIEAQFSGAIISARSEPDLFMAGLRQAAWTLKRRRQFDEALDQIAELVSTAESWKASRRIASDDLSALRATALNLKALVWVNQERNHEALEMVQEAARLAASSEQFVTVNPDAVRRYRCQIMINLAQVYWKLDKKDQTLSVLKQNEEYAARAHEGSLSEAISIRAYYSYSCGDYSTALALTRRGYGFLRQEGCPNRLASLRKVAVASLAMQGQQDFAQSVAERIVLDPLGFDDDILPGLQA
jgi:hypothetical protein